MREAVGRLREVPNTLSEWALGIANRLGKRMYAPNSLDHLMRQARDASRALEHGREARRPEKQGQGPDGEPGWRVAIQGR